MADKDGVKGFSSNIGFGPADRAEQKPLPLRIVCVGDFCAQSTQPAQRPLAIDAHEFDAVMARAMPRLFLECTGHLGAPKLEVDLTFKSIKDFEPTRVAAQLPALAPVHTFVAKAESLQKGELAPAEFKRDLSGFSSVAPLRAILDDLLDRIGGSPTGAQQASPEPAAEKGGALDGAIASIFSMVDTGPRKNDAAGAVDAAAASLSGGARFDLSGPLNSARKLLETQLAAIIHDPAFRALEARWRGLHLLCRNGKAASIELLNSAEGEAAGAIEKELVQPDRAGSALPVSLILCDMAIENTPEGNELLQALGALGQELQAPVVVEFDAAFLGVTGMDALAALDAPATLFDAPAFDKLRSLRGKDDSRWLAPALNRFAARQPWSRAKGGMDEKITGAGEVLWASPVWLVGASVARSQENTGWPASHTGVSDGEVPCLAVFDITGRDNQYPLQAVLPDRHLKDLSRAGLTPLMCQRGHDSAWVLQAPVLHTPSRAEEEGKLHSLAYALLAARIGASIIQAKGRLASANDADRTQVNFEQFLDGLLSDTGPGAGASVEISGDSLRLRLRVGRAILNGVEIELALPLQ